MGKAQPTPPWRRGWPFCTGHGLRTTFVITVASTFSGRTPTGAADVPGPGVPGRCPRRDFPLLLPVAADEQPKREPSATEARGRHGYSVMTWSTVAPESAL